MLKLVLPFCAFLAFAACTSSGKKDINSEVTDASKLPGADTNAGKPISTIRGSVDEKPLEAVNDMLKWYAKNYGNLVQQTAMVNGNGTSGTAYSVNFNATEKYLEQLQKTGYFSNSYLDLQRQNFKRADADFKTTPQKTGAPKGFELNLILPSKQFNKDLADYELAKPVTQVVSGQKNAVIILEFPSGIKMNYSMSRNGEKWQIDNISDATGY